jgi:hypothetical protein
MPRFAEESKTPMSNPAKVLLAYMRLSGQWDSRALAAEFDVPLRTIQRWKMECAASATDATGAISGVPLVHEHNATRATDATDGAPRTPDLALARDLQRAQATKASLRDTSSNIHFHPSFRPDARERESEAPADGRPASFNDATESMIADVLKFMGPTASRQNAEKWLSGTLSVYGTDRTTRAWTALVAKQARNEPVSQPLALWAKTAGGLKPQAVGPKGADPTTFHIVSPSTVRFAKPREEVGHA